MIGNELYCILSIWDDEKKQWVQKEDVGTESDYEKAKGAASDSFKRACFNIGIGRELYSAPFIYIPINKVRMGEKNGRKSVKDSFFVKMIQTSADKVITALEIVNQRSEKVFSYQMSEVASIHVADSEGEKAKVQRISEGGNSDSVCGAWENRGYDAADPETVWNRILTGTGPGDL